MVRRGRDGRYSTIPGKILRGGLLCRNDEDQDAGLVGGSADKDHAAPAKPEGGGEELPRPVGDLYEEADLVALGRQGGRPQRTPVGKLELPRLPDRQGATLAVQHPVGGVVEHRMKLPPDRPEGRVDRGPLVGGVDRPDVDGNRIGGFGRDGGGQQEQEDEKGQRAGAAAWVRTWHLR